MKNKIIIIVLNFLLLINLNFANDKSELTNPPSNSKPEWNKKMQDLNKTLLDLLTDLNSQKKLSDPKTKNKILENTKKLAKIAHDLKSIKMPQNDESDLTLPLITDLFSDDTQRAYEAFKNGHKYYAKSLIQSISSYCIACHTRNNQGPSFTNLNLQKSLSDLSQIERANFYTATRQFDEALTEYFKIIKDSKIAQNNSFEWENAIKTATAILVRVKQNPDELLKLLDTALNVSTAPQFIKDTLQVWKKSTEEWKKEIHRKLNTEEGFNQEAIRLLSRAKETQKYPADQAGAIYYLRATTVLHDKLRLYPNTQNAAESLYMLGLAVEALGDMNLWSLHEMMFESCIHKAPHTEIAKQCYHHYEKSIYQGYSGSGGVFIPKSELQKLNQLKELAMPKSEKQP